MGSINTVINRSLIGWHTRVGVVMNVQYQEQVYYMVYIKSRVLGLMYVCAIDC